MNEIYSIVLLNLKICIISTIISGIFAIFLAFYLGLNENKLYNTMSIEELGNIIKTPTNGKAVKLDMLNYICVNQVLDQN